MLAELACFEQHCRARFPIDEAIYNCPVCGGLLEVAFAEARLETDGIVPHQSLQTSWTFGHTAAYIGSSFIN